MKNKIFKLFAVVLCIGALMLLFAGCSGSDGMHITENSKGEAFNDSIGEDVDLSDTVVDAEGSAAEEGRNNGANTHYRDLRIFAEGTENSRHHTAKVEKSAARSRKSGCEGYGYTANGSRKGSAVF